MRRFFLLMCVFLLCCSPARSRPEEVPVLTAGMAEGEGEDVDLRQEAALALGAIGEAAVPELLIALESNDPELRGFAAVGLGAAGPAAKPYLPRVIEELMAQQGAMGDELFSMNYAIAYALGRGGEDAVALLVDELPKGGDRARLAMLVIGNAGPAAALAVDDLVAQLGSADPGLRADAADALAQIGPAAEPAMPALIGALRDANRDVRSRAAYALGELQLKPELAVPALMAALEQDPADLGTWYMQALGEYGSEATPAIPLLAKLLVDPVTCQDAELALAGIGAPAVPVLSSALTNSDPEVRYYAAVGLGAIGPEAAAAVPALLLALDDPVTNVRWQAAQCLGHIGEEAGQVVPALQGLLGDGDNTVRYCAAYALGNFRGEASAAVDDLARLLSDTDSEVRWGAAGALLQIGPAAATAEDDLIAALRAPPGGWDARGRIVATLLLIGSNSESLAAEISAAMRDEDVTLEVADSLGELGAPGVGVLAEMVRSKDPNPRLYAAAKLAEMGSEASAALPALTEALAEEHGLCAVVLAHAIIAAGGEASIALPAIASGLADADPQAQWYAAHALGGGHAVADIAQSAPGIVEGLRRLLKSDSYANHLAAVWAIQKLGPLARDAVPEVMAILQDSGATDVGAD